jgi:hypothetical protein
MRQSLDKTLRKQLETTVIKARDVVEQAVTEAITRMGVAEAQAPTYLSDAERALRNALRAHGRQLGDKLTDGKQTTDALMNEMAYEHWHRMLFARFLEQNNLLMYDEYTSVTLDECAELAEEEADCKDGLELAGRLAAKMLPQIFRIESPVFQVKLSINHTNTLESLIAKLDPAVYQAQDSLGWCYQFWQTKKKQQVNDSGVKIGAQELSPVTQLFTEPYMVSFLLDNALGAWWANKRLTQDDLRRANNEQELREKAAIPGVPLNYLRFVKHQESQWQLASGGFEQWPSNLSELKTLDPCCGSGHFLVAVFLMLVPMRMHQEGLSARDAVDQVIRENLHGLELDQRCVELAAFAIALEGWRFPEAGGYRALPELHLACSGLSIHAAKDEWKTISAAAGKQNLTIALDSLYKTFKDAPVLGSLINPRRSTAANIAEWTELHLALNAALQTDQNHAAANQITTISQRIEAGIVAQGITKAAELLTDQYSWVITNVPYLARGKQNDTLKGFCETHYPEGKNDLATAFLDRCLEFCTEGGTSSIVMPQNWLFLTSYKKFREKLLVHETWHSIARLGPGAFDTISGEVVKAILITLSHSNNEVQTTGLLSDKGGHTQLIRGIDVSTPRNGDEKAALLVTDEVKSVEQAKQLDNPDSIVSLHSLEQQNLLSNIVSYSNGIQAGDSSNYVRYYWECSNSENIWTYYLTPSRDTSHFSGMDSLFKWENGSGSYWKYVTDRLGDGGQKAWVRGANHWGKKGISVSATGKINANVFSGSFWNDSVLSLVPNDKKLLSAIYCYCTSAKFEVDVRKVDQKLNVRSAITKVLFDLDYWSSLSGVQYPNGIPHPYTNDPTQWIFHGHPCGSVIWDEDSKWTVEGELRTDDTVAQVAVARLLGYQWPAELDPEMELCVEQRAWVERCAELAEFADDDGIVCLPALRGEGRAEKRLVDLLMKAYGPAWSVTVEEKLLSSLKAKDWESWLREKFFEQHCKLFQSRPFIWQIWDGEKDGFSALVNYHKLDYKGLERLIYTYLDSWISHQKQDVAAGVDGADIRLTAAENLKQQLVAILEGEKGLDIFVRWKPLSEQPIGWNPDLNDGVRLNIRPFMLAKDVGKKGAGVLRAKPNVHWKKDRGTDVASAPWYHLGLEYGGKEGDRINEHHLTLQEKKIAKEQVK